MGSRSSASLPFCLGALSCAISYLWLGSMARRARHEALLVGSLVLPYFAVIGGSAAIYPRYCLPLLPFLCLGAGFVTVRALSAPGAWGAVGSIAASLALLHSLLVSIALASGFNENARLAAIADLTARARAWSAERPRSTTPRVGIFPFMRIYDGLGARLKESPDLRLSGFEADVDWLERGGPDFLVFSEPFLLRSLRVDALNGDSFWADLTDEKLGYKRVAKIEPGFAGKGIYAALDPLFVHAWTNGDIGFSIFERVAPRARGSSGRRP